MKGILLATVLWALPGLAHELQDNRATLVLRENNHVTLTVYVGLADALHLALAPQRPLGEFLASWAAMKPEELQKQLLQAQKRFEAGTRLVLPQGGELALTNWVWPDARQVQSLLQRRIMQSLVDPGGHFHEDPTEIHAEAVAVREIASLRVQFPEEFQRVLVVAYRPSQVWAEPRTMSPAIRF